MIWMQQVDKNKNSHKRNMGYPWYDALRKFRKGIGLHKENKSLLYKPSIGFFVVLLVFVVLYFSIVQVLEASEIHVEIEDMK